MLDRISRGQRRLLQSKQQARTAVSRVQAAVAEPTQPVAALRPVHRHAPIPYNAKDCHRFPLRGEEPEWRVRTRFYARRLAPGNNAPPNSRGATQRLFGSPRAPRRTNVPNKWATPQ